MPERNVVIVLARCARARQSYGMRFERRAARQWTGTWAFAINDAAAKKEGYDHGQISGEFAFDEGFPGCPHCGSHHFFKCHCGKVACWNGASTKVTCPWCGNTGVLSGEVNSLAAGGDR